MSDRFSFSAIAATLAALGATTLAGCSGSTTSSEPATPVDAKEVPAATASEPRARHRQRQRTPPRRVTETRAKTRPAKARPLLKRLPAAAAKPQLPPNRTKTQRQRPTPKRRLPRKPATKRQQVPRAVAAPEPAGKPSATHRAPPTGVGLGLRWDFLEEVLDGPKLPIHSSKCPRRTTCAAAVITRSARASARELPDSHARSHLSLGGADALDPTYTSELKTELQRLATPWHSDHLCFSSSAGRVLHELLPLKCLTRTSIASSTGSARPRTRSASRWPSKTFHVCAGRATANAGSRVHRPNTPQERRPAALGRQQRICQLAKLRLRSVCVLERAPARARDRNSCRWSL